MFLTHRGQRCLSILFSLFIWTGISESRAEILAVTFPYRAPKGDYVTQQDRYHTFRIPGMVVTGDGSILAFAEGRRGGGSDPTIDENAPIDMVLRRSTDQGRTWKPIQVIDSGFRPDGSLVDFADPTPVFDAMTQTVHLLYGQWPDRGPMVMKPGQSPDADAVNHVTWVRSSSDHGRSWSQRRQIDYPDEPSETNDGFYWRQAEPGPGHGIQLQWQDPQVAPNGRLVVPAKRYRSRTPDGPATAEPFVYYSDDHGRTWKVGRATGGPAANEDEVVELTDGRLLLDARQTRGAFRRRHISADGGLSWGPDLSDSIALTRVDGSMVRYSAARAGHDKDRILFSAPQGRGGLNRTRITVWTSYDEGKTFVNPVKFNDGFAAYSVLQRLSDGTIGLLAETSQEEGVRYGEISFHRFDIGELEQDTRR